MTMGHPGPGRPAHHHPAQSVVEEPAKHLGPVGRPTRTCSPPTRGVLWPSNVRVKVWLPAVRAAGLAPLRPSAAHGRPSKQENPPW
jgi:hypothetical protein